MKETGQEGMHHDVPFSNLTNKLGDNSVELHNLVELQDNQMGDKIASKDNGEKQELEDRFEYKVSDKEMQDSLDTFFDAAENNDDSMNNFFEIQQKGPDMVSKKPFVALPPSILKHMIRTETFRPIL